MQRDWPCLKTAMIICGINKTLYISSTICTTWNVQIKHRQVCNSFLCWKNHQTSYFYRLQLRLWNIKHLVMKWGFFKGKTHVNFKRMVIVICLEYTPSGAITFSHISGKRWCLDLCTKQLCNWRYTHSWLYCFTNPPKLGTRFACALSTGCVQTCVPSSRGLVKQYNQELCISSITRCFTKRLQLRPLQ